eukprot:15469844-Alexandrium_andersonii.AAC.1
MGRLQGPARGCLAAHPQAGVQLTPMGLQAARAEDQGAEDAVDCRTAPTAQSPRNYQQEGGMRRGTAGGAGTSYGRWSATGI